mmetsp:Transcript_47726/g.91212  ORF Transcript_47726/g.91212 Transcript_47726/m.91212 type:complete len:299 (+) Transcript_47726:2567-3463(+)
MHGADVHHVGALQGEGGAGGGAADPAQGGDADAEGERASSRARRAGPRGGGPHQVVQVCEAGERDRHPGEQPAQQPARREPAQLAAVARGGVQAAGPHRGAGEAGQGAGGGQPLDRTAGGGGAVARRRPAARASCARRRGRGRERTFHAARPRVEGGPRARSPRNLGAEASVWAGGRGGAAQSKAARPHPSCQLCRPPAVHGRAAAQALAHGEPGPARRHHADRGAQAGAVRSVHVHLPGLPGGGSQLQPRLEPRPTRRATRKRRNGRRVRGAGCLVHRQGRDGRGAEGVARQVPRVF